LLARFLRAARASLLRGCVLAIGMAFGFASGFLAVVVMVMKFGPDLLFSYFGTGPLNILSQRTYGITTSYALVSVVLFTFVAKSLERSGIAGNMHDTLEKWMSRTRGGIAFYFKSVAPPHIALPAIFRSLGVFLDIVP